MRISRKTGALSGFLLVVLGLWGGMIPFVGPYFGYAFGSHATWHFTTNRLWLDVLPGAAVLVGGVMLIWSGHRVIGTAASWLAMAGGAWFAVGPAVSRLWEHGGGPIGVPLFGHTRQTFELIGYFYGLGIVVVGLAAFALGRFVTRQALVPAPPADEPPATDSPPATEEPSEPAQPTEDEASTESGQRVPAGVS
ncbi:MAG: hypothetical protein KGL16_11245 [Acidobacteriota bacterium]|nr:hypothetical protein [Acidobacteriota bacterium]